MKIVIRRMLALLASKSLPVTVALLYNEKVVKGQGSWSAKEDEILKLKVQEVNALVFSDCIQMFFGSFAFMRTLFNGCSWERSGHISQRFVIIILSVQTFLLLSISAFSTVFYFRSSPSLPRSKWVDVWESNAGRDM